MDNKKTTKYPFILEEWYKANPNIEADVDSLLTTNRPRVGSSTPRGYKLSENGQVCEPVPEIITFILTILAEQRYKKVRSQQDCLDQYNKLFGGEYDEIGSCASLSNIFSKYERWLKLSEKETAYERLKRHRKEKRAEKIALGLPLRNQYSKATLNKRAAQKKLTETNKELKELKRKERILKQRAARNARSLKLKETPTKYVEDTEDPGNLKYEKSLSNYDLEKVPKKREVFFEPTAKQIEFLSADEDIVLYGGAAGGGKSYAMLVDPLRYAHIPEHNAMIIRKTMPELNELIDTSREMYPKAFPGAKYRETTHVWTFPSGAKIRFGYLDRPADKFKYQGKAYSYVGFDELSQHATNEGFNYLRSRLRRVNPEIKPYIRATANPGSQWVYEMFIKDHEPNKAFIMPGTENNKRPITMKFIPAKLEDNPYLDEDGLYRSQLESLDEVLKRQLLEGDWLASNDTMFAEFQLDVHVCDPFFVPKHWNRVAGLDYGYVDPSAAVWFAVNPDDNSIVVYDEFAQPGLTGREFALAINEKEREELVIVDHPVDWSIYARSGHIGPSIAESMYSVPGFRMRRADKSREAGWVQIHELLRRDPVTGAPKIQIFSSCKNLIRQLLSAKVHKTKAGDLDDTRTSDGHWDLLDALRYGVMSRPRQKSFQHNLGLIKQESSWKKVDSYFSA